jgi:regulatory protein
LAVRPHSPLPEGHTQSEAAAAQSSKALELAYRFVNRRERTVSEVRRHLVRHDIPSAAAEHAVATLLGHGYLDDERFVRLFVEDKRTLEGWGQERIIGALMQRGIERELAAAACPDDGAELERAVELLQRRFQAPARTRRDRDRMLGVLIRKGYQSELAIEAVASHTRASSEELQ